MDMKSLLPNPLEKPSVLLELSVECILKGPIHWPVCLCVLGLISLHITKLPPCVSYSAVSLKCHAADNQNTRKPNLQIILTLWHPVVAGCIAKEQLITFYEVFILFCMKMSKIKPTTRQCMLGRYYNHLAPAAVNPFFIELNFYLLIFSLQLFYPVSQWFNNAVFIFLGLQKIKDSISFRLKEKLLFSISVPLCK